MQRRLRGCDTCCKGTTVGTWACGQVASFYAITSNHHMATYVPGRVSAPPEEQFAFHAVAVCSHNSCTCYLDSLPGLYVTAHCAFCSLPRVQRPTSYMCRRHGYPGRGIHDGGTCPYTRCAKSSKAAAVQFHSPSAALHIPSSDVSTRVAQASHTLTSARLSKVAIYRAGEWSSRYSADSLGSYQGLCVA